ncbi:MAG: PsbP-related protein [Candidatus Paceibacterota bacterium]|jgi:hypothetical protein
MNTTQKGFASVVLIIALVIIIVGWLGYFELTQKSSVTTTSSPEKSQSTKEDQEIPWKEYVNLDFGISFSHPDSWQCKTYKTNLFHPDWYQTICDDDGTWSGDSLVAISVPHTTNTRSLGVSTIRSGTITGQNSSTITKTIYHSDKFEDLGSVAYIFSGSSNMKSYDMGAMYGGLDKPYRSAEEAEDVLDTIAKSLIIRSN